ncbi:MAG: hypothetical protein SNJ71_06495 [Bacteroidales bacterium]
MKTIKQTVKLKQNALIQKISLLLTLLTTATTNASAQGASQDFRTGLNTALGVIILISTVWAVITAWGGIQRIKEGDPTGKNSIWAAILIFIIPLLIFAVARRFFSGIGDISPSFDF